MKKFHFLLTLILALSVAFISCRKEPKEPDPEPNDSEIITVNGVNFEMMVVKGGIFTMGRVPERDDVLGMVGWPDELPAHQVTLSDFKIGKYPVTQALWKAVMGTDTTPSWHKGDNLPVENVMWSDCIEFITKLNGITGRNFRLPTEAEWEFAARGGVKSRGYKYGGSTQDINLVAWWAENSGNKTHPVGLKKANELQIHDMSGNVREWCSDWYGPYTATPKTNPKGPEKGEYRVARGGSFYSLRRDNRIATREALDQPYFTSHGLGFRLVLQ